jgi:signal transduction histidine kinase
MKKIIQVFFYFLCPLLIFSQEPQSIEDLKKELKNVKVDTLKTLVNLKIAKLFIDNNELDSAFFYINNSLTNKNSNNLKNQIAESIAAIGKAYRADNEFQQAIHYYTKAVEVFKEIGNKEDVSILYNWIGYSYINIYAEDKAIEFYLKSLEICKEIGNESSMAMNYLDIGNLYYQQEHFQNAKKYFQDALTIYEKLEDTLSIASSYINLGNAFSDNMEYDIGIDYYKQSLIIYQQAHDNYGVATNYNNLGDVYLQTGKYILAEDYFLKAIEIGIELDENELLGVVYVNMADLNSQLKNHNQVIDYAKKSLKISSGTGMMDVELTNLKFLADAYEALGNEAEALVFLKRHNVLRDTLLINDKAKKVQLFNALNELDKSQYTISDLSTKNEIAELKIATEKKISYYLIIAIAIFAFLLIVLINQQTSKKKAYNLLEFRNYQINKMNDEIQEQRDYLNQLNKTKDRFFSIIAHDLKNPFNSIKGFTELLIDNNDEYDQEKQLKFLRIIKESTNKASVLLNNLLIWANSQSGNLNYTPKRIELVKHVLDVVSLLEIQAIKKEIDIYNNIDHNLSVLADENMLNTILRNLISNAIKFTKQQGEIKILSEINENMVEITVKDNGVGISEKDIETLFNLDEKNTNVGTANEQGSGLGLILCKDFIEKNGGKIWVKSVEGVGTEFVFSIPLWEDEFGEL